MTQSTDTIDVNLSAIDADGQTLTYSVEVVTDPAAQLAYDLDQQLGIEDSARLVENDYFLNYRGLNERYLTSSNSQWFYILSDGSLYQWGGSIAESTFIAKLDSRYYQDPSLLLNAQLPTAPEVSVSIIGSTLTITPPVDFLGLFEVTVSVSDGHRSGSRTFLVDVNDSKSSSTTFLDAVFSDLNVMDL